MPAILFGSISTIADTSELQREAFNRAFEAHSLEWSWDRDEYRSLLESSGGEDRIASYARSHGQEVDAAAIHATKSEFFQGSLAEAGLEPRNGVLDTVHAARDKGMKVALVTTTSGDNVAALMSGLSPALGADDFDLVVDADSVVRPKPAPDAYRFALTELGEDPGACVAIEDNLGGVESAEAAGLHCLAFPNANTAGHDFAAADARAEKVELGALEQLIGEK
jgi:HAD superfamily hydrolase (TIGR01509 family)